MDKIRIKEKRKKALDRAALLIDKELNIKEILYTVRHHFLITNQEYQSGDYLKVYSLESTDLVVAEGFYSSARLSDNGIVEYYIADFWWPSYQVEKEYKL